MHIERTKIIMLENNDIYNYILNNKADRFALMAKSNSFEVWLDDWRGTLLCWDKRIEADRQVWNEVNPVAFAHKDDWENWNFESKEEELEFLDLITNCEVSAEYTIHGLTKIRWYSFKHVYHINAYVRCDPNGPPTLDEQVKSIEEYCAKYLPYASINWHIDDCSPSIPFTERKAYTNIQKSILDHESTLLIVSDFGKITKNAISLYRAIEEMLRNDVRVISVNNNIDSISPIWYDATAHQRGSETTDFAEISRKIVSAYKSIPKYFSKKG